MDEVLAPGEALLRQLTTHCRGKILTFLLYQSIPASIDCNSDDYDRYLDACGLHFINNERSHPFEAVLNTTTLVDEVRVRTFMDEMGCDMIIDGWEAMVDYIADYVGGMEFSADMERLMAVKSELIGWKD